ncbi:hypothetical protein KKF84_05450 [Myxococcota bacterium]|nr:hypothetical protein [Myxococcota bacterium]MBU1534743.1 hypothetical protein [Myxococcota bacterium]
MKQSILTLLALTLFLPSTAMGQTTDFLTDKPKEVKLKKYGWHPMLKTSGTVSWSKSKDVVGQTDGSTWNLGYILTGQLIYLSKTGHEWKNDLGWQLNFVKTPLIDQFSKSLDNFEISSAYLYHFPKVKWMGPYGQLGMRTSMLDGYMLNASGADLNIRFLNAKGEEIRTATYAAQDSVDLTKPFSPTVLKESIGFFMKPFERPWAKPYIQLGGGAWEIYGRNGWTVADDAATTDALEVKALEDTIQMGVELNLVMTGTIKKDINYSLKANFMMPVYTNSETSLSGMDLLNMDFEFKAGYKLSKYFSLDYSFKAVKIPLVSDKWQIQNGLVLSFNIALIEPPKIAAKKIKMCPCAAVADPKSDARPVEVKPTEPPKDAAPKNDKNTPPAEVNPADPAKTPEPKPDEGVKPTEIKPEAPANP